MNASRVLLIILLMLTSVWTNPAWAQSGSAPAGATIRGNNSHTDVSSDWAKKDVEVPNVVGLWRDEAILDLFKAGLRIGDVREETITSVSDHHVISESPAAGTEAKGGSKVDLVIARAPEVKVPDLVGLTVSAAKAVLDKVDLKVGQIDEKPSATVPAGLIISQHPRAGTTVREDRRVRLMVSKGTSQDTVPNVIGATQAAAATAIASAGLNVGTVTMQSNATVAMGLVISESPSAGSSVAAKSAVNLVVSSGVAKIAVPNVLGLTQAAATTAITAVGLTVGTVTSQSSTTVAAGLVISESPAAGTSVVSGSAVNIIVSSGGASGTSIGGSPITVPGVGQVTFPAGYLSSTTTATLLVSNTNAIATAIATGADILGPLTQATNEVHVQFSSAPLTAGDFNISLNLPGDLQSAVSQGGQPTILAAFHYLSQDSEASEDATDFDQIDNVSYDPTTQIISGQLPISAVDTIFGPTLEAVLKIVVFPAAQTAPTSDPTQSIKKVLPLGSSAGAQTTSPPLLYPLVAVPPLIIGPFGEPGHAGGPHGGIDLRTLGTGKQVQAVAAGWISQISLSSGKTNCCASPQPAYCGSVAAAPTTYAKPGANPYTLSVVQQLNSGGAVAYRHLTFGSVSVSGVTSISSQLCYIDNGSHVVSVKQGDIIALSGDSGAPGAPHLHFEYTSQSAAAAINSQKGAFRQNGIFQLGQLEMSQLGQQVNASSPMSLDLTAAGAQVQAQIVASTAAQILVRRYKPPSLGNPDTNGCYAGEVCLPATAQDTGTSATFQSGSSYPIFAFNGPPTLWSGYDLTIASITNPAVTNTQCATLANGVSTDCGLYTIRAANGSVAGVSTSATYTLTPKARYVGATGTGSTESIAWNLGAASSGSTTFNYVGQPMFALMNCGPSGTATCNPGGLLKATVIVSPALPANFTGVVYLNPYNPAQYQYVITQVTYTYFNGSYTTTPNSQSGVVVLANLTFTNGVVEFWDLLFALPSLQFRSYAVTPGIPGQDTLIEGSPTYNVDSLSNVSGTWSSK